MSYFSDNYNELHYPINLENTPGLRNAQLGAIHAIAAFHTLHKKNAGIIIMPTGSGKTAVLMMTPYIVHAKKILIVTPSVMVRGQIYEDFANLTTLKRANVFPETLIPPRVYELENMYSDAVRENVEIADVVVASHPCALSLSKSAIKSIFNLVLVDEAHHVPAKTWQKILNNMNEASHYLFTATPFRSDKKEIKGEILYSYPLSMAYRDGIFGEINYIPIEEAPDKDKLIAKEAERVFFDDRQKGYDHYLMVRTDTKKKAKGLEKLYQEQTSLKLERIDSSMTLKDIKSCIEALKNKRIDGIICVDMLGEGFDFPNLKIAAIHKPHQSLSSTLQFIGRFARTNAENIGSAKFIAMNDNEFVLENNMLFTNDAVWQKIIIDISEGTIRKEEEVKKNLKEYVRDNGSTAFDDSISLYSLRPNCHAKVYHISSFNIQGTFPDTYSVGDRVYRNPSDNTVVGIGKIHSRPRWITTNHVMDVENLLFIVHYQKETSLLFIYSQIKNEIDYEAIARAFAEGFDKIPKNEMHRVLAEFQSYEMFNTGMRNRYAENGLSYLIRSGPNVAASIDPTAGRIYAAGHVFCKVDSDKNKSATIGYSSGSKMWSSSYVSITDYVRWCNENGKKIVNSSMVVRTNTNYDFIPLSTRISEFPEDVFFVFFSDKTFSSPVVYINSNEELTDVLLTDAVILLDDISKDKITFSVTLEETTDSLVYTPDGRYTCDQSNIFLKVGRNKLSLVEYFNNNPLTFITLDDSVIEGSEITIWGSKIDIFMPDEINGIDWDKYMTDIRREFGETINGKKPIQTALLEILNESNKYTYLIYDHGTGEIADYITITENDDTIETVLYHVKAMSGGNYNDNLKDIYEVTQQAIKSMIWLKSQWELLNKIRLRRESNHCRLKKGNYEDLEKTLKQKKPFTAKIVIVQPAISQSIDFPAKYQEVLAATRFYINSSGRFTLEIWGSK